MNCSAYVFGELFSGYNQYPEDNSSLVYQEIAANCKASQHRSSFIEMMT